MKKKLGSNVPMQPTIPKMPSNTSNALEALNSVNTTQFNALDSISRQAAIDELTEYGNGRAVYIAVEEAVRRIEQLPPAGSQIIRCKDCKHFKQVLAPNDNDGLCGHWHSKSDARTNRNGYCSHAERKQE